MKAPKIVPVPEKMQKYYGVGNMLHPDIEMIEEAISLIPEGKVVTIENLAKKLAADYSVDVTCPMRTGNALKSISKTVTPDNYKTSLPFWRVIRTDKKMANLHNYEFWATLLEKEGLILDYTPSNEIKIIAKDHQVFLFK